MYSDIKKNYFFRNQFLILFVLQVYENKNFLSLCVKIYFFRHMSGKRIYKIEVN